MDRPRLHHGSPPRTLGEILRERASQRPDQLAFTFLADDGQLSQWTYADLDRRARGIARFLSERFGPGERAALAFPPGLDFIAAYFGCIYAGVLPAPATYPRPNRPSSRLDAIVDDCSPVAALTTSAMRRSLRLEEQSPGVRALHWCAVDELPLGDDPGASPHAAAPDDLAFLQYTSGSTSDPRGVMVTHSNLLHNLEQIRVGFQLPQHAEEESVCGVFWLPAYHDMGLIGGILTPLYVGATSHLMAPATFLRRPLTWLQTLSSRRAQISGAPNFAYEMCCSNISSVDRRSLDLSNWRLAFSGAEPIHADVLEQFAETFADAHFRSEAFYPCYGLAEATLLVSGGDGPAQPSTIRVAAEAFSENRITLTNGDGAATRELVSCGAALGDQQVIIVDAKTQLPCADDSVGEVWIRGGSVARGYWNNDDSTRQAFDARLSNGDGPYLRTGDLGFLHEGELFVTGRLKDVVIIRGRNLYPQDVERTAQQAHPAIDLGAAFSVDVDGREKLVVAHQVHREHRRDDLQPVLRVVRAAIVEEYEIDPHAVLLLRPMSIPTTTSGKVQRSLCRERWLANEFAPIAECRRSSAENDADLAADLLSQAEELSERELADRIEAWMLAWLASRTGAAREELAGDQPFTALGIDSLTAVELNQEFENVLRVEVPPIVAWDYPTPIELSQFLASQMHASDAVADDVASTAVGPMTAE